jgi:hypothetical protein
VKKRESVMLSPSPVILSGESPRFAQGRLREASVSSVKGKRQSLRGWIPAEENTFLTAYNAARSIIQVPRSDVAEVDASGRLCLRETAKYDGS